MTEEQERDLIENVKSVTDRLTIVDQILKSAKLGREMVMVFQCGESGIYYPADYIKEWGRKYGIGLGPHPVSESLQSDYDIAPPSITSDTRRIEQIMHPLRVSCAQMDLDTIPLEDFLEREAVLAMDDPYLDTRANIVRMKQLVNPRSRLRNMQVAWDNAGRKN